MKLAFIAGTRPEFLKIAQMIKICEKNNHDYILIHSNQHYSKDMDEIFFTELELPKPHYNINVGSGSHAYQTAKIIVETEKILQEEKVDIIIVQGDTNTTMSGALAASKCGVKVAHVEAGLRSYDRAMPEEINRIIVDGISDFLFTVSSVQTDILLKENTSKDKIFEVGNTIVDTLLENKSLAEKSTIIDDYKLEKYILVTMHRPSNVDNKESFRKQIANFDIFIKKGFQIIWPIHPRAKKNIEDFEIKLQNEVKLLPPVGYLDFISLMTNADYIVTDSGGIQEEACILKVPCITLRENTERPETLNVGSNKLVGNDQKLIEDAIQYFESRDSNWRNPFGDGKTSQKILEALLK